MKKFTAFLLIAAMVGTLAGCGGSTGTMSTGGSTEQGGASSSGSGEADASGLIDDGGIFWNTQTQMYELEEEVLNGTATLKAWVDNDGFAEALQTGFMEKYPGVNLEVMVVSTGDAADKMALEGEAGTGADAFMLVHDNISKAMNSSIIGMFGRYDEQIRERYLESAVGVVDIDGQIYGAPLLIESAALFYNKTLLNQLAADGYIASADVPKDFEDIKEIAKVYNDERNNKWTMRWETGNAYMNHYVLTAFGYELFGPDRNDPEKLNLSTPEAIKGLEYHLSLKEVFDVPSADTNWDTTVVEFGKGETPFLLVGPWAIEEVAKGAEENGFEFGIAPLPKVDGNQAYTFSGVQLACVSAYSKYPAAARALAMYMAGDEMAEFLYGSLNKIPSLKEEYANKIPGLKDDERVQGVMQQAAFSQPMPAIKETEYYWTVAETMMRSVWDGVMTPEAAAQKAQEDYNTLRSTAE
jgi:arabinogalactan oligomer/maltooligosaccharide transport system substrate-binding protein